MGAPKSCIVLANQYEILPDFSGNFDTGWRNRKSVAVASLVRCRYVFNAATGHSGCRLSMAGQVIGGGDLDNDWFLYRKPSFTVSVASLSVSLLFFRDILASSETRFPVARATRKMVFWRRSSEEIWLFLNLEFEKASKIKFSDHEGTTSFLGGSVLNCALVCSENSSMWKGALPGIGWKSMIV